MNRRHFFFAASAAFGIIGKQATAQRSSTASDILTSKLTGGTIDISGTSLPTTQHHVDSETGAEHLHFELQSNGLFDINFWPTANGSSADEIQSIANMWISNGGPGELLNSATYDDGGWLAFSVFDSKSIGYFEYQLEAYPGHDLQILLVERPDIFAATFAEVQSILIDGIEPLLFHEDADIVKMAASMVNPTEAPTAAATTRTRRNSVAGSNESETTTSTTKTSTSDASSTGDPIQLVRDHQEDFHVTTEEYLGLLDSVADEAATQVEIVEDVTALTSIASSWIDYPTRAAGVEFETSQSDLETTYLDWADEISSLGSAFIEFLAGGDVLDVVLDQTDVVAAIDEDLTMLLGSETGIAGELSFLRTSRNKVARIKSTPVLRFARFA